MQKFKTSSCVSGGGVTPVNVIKMVVGVALGRSIIEMDPAHVTSNFANALQFAIR